MKRRILGLLALAMWAVPALSATPELVDAVRARLKQPTSLRGTFEQSKTVQGFAKPLRSRGEFMVARGQGVLWRTLQPFASELRLTRHEIRATQAGQVALQLDASREPAVRVINGLMFALLDADVSGLAQSFAIQGSVKGAQWQLQLTPKPGPLGQVLKRIELQGDAYVRRIQLQEASGDTSLITLNELHEGVPTAGLFE